MTLRGCSTHGNGSPAEPSQVSLASRPDQRSGKLYIISNDISSQREEDVPADCSAIFVLDSLRARVLGSRYLMYDVVRVFEGNLEKQRVHCRGSPFCVVSEVDVRVPFA